MNAPSLEVRIPISPREDYFNRVRAIALSIREFYPQARVRVTVGADTQPRDLGRELPWSAGAGVEWHWVGADEFREWRGTEHPYIATMMERFRPPFRTEFVLMLDADVLAVRPFDELFDASDAVKGMMAHATPFRGTHREIWEKLFAGYGLPRPVFDAEHSGWELMDAVPAQQHSPPYLNTGVVFARTAVLERLYEPYMAALRYVREQIDSYFFEQIALTLACEKSHIPVELLPLRYNFPNQPEFDAAHPAELANIKLLHFLRTQIVDREKEFESIGAMRRLAARRDLSGSNEVLRARIAEVLERMA